MESRSQATYQPTELKLPSFQYAYRFTVDPADPDFGNDWFTLNALFAGYYNPANPAPANADRKIAGLKVKNLSDSVTIECGGVQQLRTNVPGPPQAGFPLGPGETDIVTLDRLGAYALRNPSAITPVEIAIKFVAYEE